MHCKKLPMNGFLALTKQNAKENKVKRNKPRSSFAQFLSFFTHWITDSSIPDH